MPEPYGFLPCLLYDRGFNGLLQFGEHTQTGENTQTGTLLFIKTLLRVMRSRHPIYLIIDARSSSFSTADL